MPRLSLAPLWAVPPILIGVALAAWLVSTAEGPARDTDSEPALAVRVAEVSLRDIRPQARGWGDVRAAETWVAVAEVKGQVIWRHPELEPGRMIPADTVVLRLDQTDYRLAIDQAEADLQALQAEGLQITTKRTNTERVLELEQARLALAQTELDRVQALVEQGASPRARADEAERAALAARRTVVELQNILALIGPREARIKAQKARTQASLDRARRDLSHTELRTPFDVRVIEVGAERHQFIAVGQVVTRGDGVSAAEAVAQVPVPDFRRVLPGGGPGADLLTALREGWLDRIGVQVSLVADPSQIWPASIARVEGALDPRARTVPVVVRIEEPYASAAPPLRMPLVPNMRVEITLTGPPVKDAVVIPDAALHGDLVYIVTADDRLDLRPVRVAFRQNGVAVIAEGLAAGDRVVLDDIAPAIPGQLLIPVEDQK